MDPFTISLLAGGALGLGKYFTGKQSAKKARELKAAHAENSPWLKVDAPPNPNDPNFLGEMAKGIGTGALLGSSFSGAGAAGAATSAPSTAMIPGIAMTPAQQNAWMLMNSQGNVG